MIPDNVETFTTEGEGQFYRFLATAEAKEPGSGHVEPMTIKDLC